MPIPSLPSSINHAKWNTLAKGVDNAKIGATMEKLSKAHLAAANSGAFDAPKFKSPEEAEKALKSLSAAEKEVQSALNEAKLLSKLAKENSKEIGKQKAEAGKLLDSVAGEATDYAKKLEAALAASRTAIETAAEEAKKKKGGDEEDDEEKDSGDVDKLLKRNKGALMRELVKYEPKPGERSRYRFMLSWTGQGAMLFAGKLNYGPKQLQMHAQKLRTDKPMSTVGDLTFEKGDDGKGVYVFSCRGKIPPRKAVLAALRRPEAEGGVGKALSNVKIRKLVKSKSGEEKFEDASEADEEGVGPDLPPEAAEEQTASQSPAQTAATGRGGDVKVDAAAAVRAHRDALAARVQAAVRAGGPNAAKLREAMAKVEENLASKPDTAAQWLRGVEKLLDASAGTATGGQTPPEAPPKPTGGGDGFATQMAQVRTAWTGLHKRFHDGVDELLKLLDEVYREEPEQKKEVDRAKAELKAAAGKVGREVEAAIVMLINAKDKAARDAAVPKARTLIEGTRNTLAADRLLAALDGNELKSDMVVVKPMQDLLDRLSKSLG